MIQLTRVMLFRVNTAKASNNIRTDIKIKRKKDKEPHFSSGPYDESWLQKEVAPESKGESKLMQVLYALLVPTKNTC